MSYLIKIRFRKSFIILLAVLCLLASHSLFALSLSHVNHSPKYLDFDTTKAIKIRFTLDQPAMVTLAIFDDREIMIRQISSNLVLEKGEHFFLWHGKDQANRPVPAEAYRYTLTAENEREKVEYDVSDLTGGEYVDVSNIVWDKSTNVISYRLSKPARVNLRAGIANNGPLLAMLSDWLPRAYGKHQFKWDGYDNSKVLDLTQLETIEIYAQAFSLSDNTLLVGPPVQSIVDIENRHWRTIKRAPKKEIKKRMKGHHQQDRNKRGDFTVSVKLPDDLKKNDKGYPIVQETIPIRFMIKSGDQQRVINDRFEPILFIDGQYNTENEVGFFPMTWNLNPEKLTQGEHFLTVNLRGYDGHFGAASVWIDVQHPSKQVESEETTELKPLASESSEEKPAQKVTEQTTATSPVVAPKEK
ncbi:MAG: hypothetical protein OQL19_17795 [Gammaproteobacteria bacterium]|nr:hypothetical protein [Gammaproteobacteria bacterium]